MASPSRDVKCVWFLFEGRLPKAGVGKLFCHHPSCLQFWPSALRLLLCVCGACPALLVPFPMHSAACLNLVLCTAPASHRLQCSLARSRDCEKGSVCQPSIISRPPLSSQGSFVKTQVCALSLLSALGCAASDTQGWLLS